MSATDLLVLAERCEREEPSWDLCIDIELAIVPGAIHRTWDYHFRIGLGDKVYNPPAYTTRVDAAMTLVPDDFVWLVENLCGNAARVIGPEIDGQVASGVSPIADDLAKTPALALCAAALRARAAT